MFKSGCSVLLFFALFGFAFAADPSVAVTGIVTDADAGTVTVSYSLENGPAIVTVDFKDGSASLGNEQTQFLTGDVNKKVTGSTGTIVWNARRAAPDREFSALKAEVRAWSTNTPPDYMAVDLLDGAISYYESTNSLPGGIGNDLWRTDKILLKWVPIDAVGGSTFALRGSKRSVTLTKRYFLGVFVLSQRQWERVWMHSTTSTLETRRPSTFKNESCYAVRALNNVPIGSIRGSSAGYGWPDSSEVDADSFFGLLRKLTNDTHFDMPTECQWEYAGRAGTTTSRFWGDSEDPSVYTNYCRTLTYGYGTPDRETCDLSEGLARIGSFLPNQWGFYDFLGNTWEHVLDWPESYEDLNKEEKSETDRKGPQRPSSTATASATRGGFSGNDFCWYFSFSDGGTMTSQNSNNNWSGGFRVCYRVDEF